MKQFFTPIRPVRASEAAANQIRDLIYSGQLRPGDRLPSEREMANQLNVCRATLREALNILVAMDLIDIIGRKGIIVKAGAGGEIGHTIAEMVADSRQRVHELLEVRKALEAQIVLLAAKRATEEDLAAMQQALETLGQAMECEDWQDWFQRDSAFHLALAGATHNAIVLHILQRLIHIKSRQLLHTRARLYASPEARRIRYENHVKLLDIISAGDTVAAGQVAFDIFSCGLEDEKDLCV